MTRIGNDAICVLREVGERWGDKVKEDVAIHTYIHTVCAYMCMT